MAFQVTHRWGHVNDLENIALLRLALVQAKADLEHFREDVRAGLMPYEDTTTDAIERVKAALGE